MTYFKKPLGEVANFIRGITFKPENLIDTDVLGAIVCMRTKNIQADLDESDLIAIPPSFVKRDEQYIKEGDLLVSTANSWELVGKACWVPKLNYTATAGGFITILRANRSMVFPRYLYHWMVCTETQHNLRYCGRQTTNISNMSFHLAEKLEIPLPPLDEQRRIAAILDKADAIRRKRQESIRLTEEFLRSIFLDMFGDPVTNPKGWEIKQLEKLITVQGGYAFKSSDYTNEGIPLVRIGTANKKDFDVSNIVFLPTSFAKTYSRFLLSPGDMVITLTGTAGKDDYGNVNIVPDIYSKWLLNQRVAKITTTSNLITKAYLFTFLSDANVKDNMISNNRGIRQGNLNNADILSQMLPLPPMGLQEKFSEIRSNLQMLRMNGYQQFDESQQFFASLAHRAFRGEL